MPFMQQPVFPFSLTLQTFSDKPGVSVIHELTATLHRPPVAIFIAHARQRHGWRHGTVKCVTFSFPHARHATGTTMGSAVVCRLLLLLRMMIPSQVPRVQEVEDVFYSNSIYLASRWKE